MGRLDVPHDKFPGIDYEFEHFFGRESKIHTRKVISKGGNAHLHDFPQVYYCISGSCCQFVGDREYTLLPGDFIFIPAGELHTFSVEEADSYIINFNMSFMFLQKHHKKLAAEAIAYLFLGRFSDELKKELPMTLSLRDESQKLVKENFEALVELDNVKNIDQNSIIALINGIFSLSEFAFSKEYADDVWEVILGKLLPSLRAVSYMNSNFSKKIHCEDLLKVSGLCRTDFYRAIKKTVGDTYSIYLQKIRVKRAHRALGFSDYSFSYISDMCGFGSATYFGKCYKKYRGYTPKEERAALEELLRNYPAIRVTHDFFEVEYIDNERNDKK